ncbi:hypothetical protein MNBD_GAMMA08-1504 [hydrothermal vent metagenome]|uniref:2-polyprenylphenol hydroxylase and related flavodoxin oxidoreductases / CDP-6-deoxy-delta-3,4-glucoseen reductase-like n=1 Tax=hydrothermal vent metagenome TaxID=652676 RepID=A0A3B0X7B7_9ZZZZ
MLTYKIKYQKQVFNCKHDETLIDAFNRHGIVVNFSCRKGSCHACMMHCKSGTIPKVSQKGLDTEFISNNYFLPCSCTPTSDMTVDNVESNFLYQPAIIHSKEVLSANICRILIDPGDTFNYKPGQYINLKRISDNTIRSYSLVSHPDDYFLEIHVKKMPSGKLSSWIFNELNTGDEIEFQGAMGDSYYEQVNSTNTPLILTGRGTGIAPLYGILLDALKNSHHAQLTILHEGRTVEDLYLQNQLTSLETKHSNVKYIACVDNSNNKQTLPHSARTILENTIDELIANPPNIFTAGSPDFTASIKTLFRNHNIPDKNIFLDSFDYKNLRDEKQKNIFEVGRRKNDPATIIQKPATKQALSRDDEMWHALGEGKKLKLILDDFYSQVYKDDKLSGFFQNSTQQRSSEKQYLFMRQIFTGEKVYFGDRPKNAHHWMVISDELFDYREKLLSQCLKKHGLAEHLIERWVNIDNTFRKDIVKQTPFPKIVNGIEMPLDGYEEIKIDEGTLCDACHNAIEKGETVRYHLRLGLTYCPHCMEEELPEQAV